MEPLAAGNKRNLSAVHGASATASLLGVSLCPLPLPSPHTLAILTTEQLLAPVPLRMLFPSLSLLTGHP